MSQEAYSLIESGNSMLVPQPSARYRSWKTSIKQLLSSLAFRAVGIACLILSLFTGALVVLLDLPDDPWNKLVDYLMTAIMLFFCVEIGLRCAVDFSNYALTFLFWMDVLGTLSMAFEISFLLGAAGRMSTTSAGDSYAMTRTTNAVRCCMRAGRLATPLRCLSMIYGPTPETRTRRGDAVSGDGGKTAKFMGERVAQALSTKVAMLTSLLVLGVPIFSLGRYPEQDFSLRMASGRLEADYSRASTAFYDKGAYSLAESKLLYRNLAACLTDLRDFYSELDYYPFKLEGYTGFLDVHPDIELSRPTPNRKQSIVVQQVSRCLTPREGCDQHEKAAIFFDFTAVRQYAAALDIFVICFLIICMGLETWDLSRSINSMVVAPLDKMLNTAHSMAAVLNQAIRRNKPNLDMDKELDDDDDEASDELDETTLLEKVFKKMARLTSVFVEQNVVDEAKLSAMDTESKGVIVEVMQYGRKENRLSSKRGSYMSTGPVVEILPVSREEIESWGLNMQKLSQDECMQVVYHVLFDSSVGKATRRIWIEFETLSAFAGIVRTGYHDNPYHNFTHGCDVLASCYRILLQVHWEDWLSDIDTVSLLVSSLVHDIGHPGKTNPFLVETSDVLALRYNDKSPLENMHCARLFEICTDPRFNVFQKFDRASYKQARAVAIAGILFTDNAMHFDLVKEVRKVFETSADSCDGDVLKADGSFAEQYMQEVIQKNTMLWIKVILHLADVSNPLKSFDMNKIWAMRVVDEFFSQGDEEKRLGIPVGMLNDRDKVNRSGAEHGFINFLLAPLVVSVVRVFPMLHSLGNQMVHNMSEWHTTWINEAKPSLEDIKKREADVEKVRDQVSELVSRTGRPSTAGIGAPM